MAARTGTGSMAAREVTFIRVRLESTAGDKASQRPHRGRLGDDVLRGGPDDDVLIGDSGRDLIRGGPGNDTTQAAWNTASKFDGPDRGTLQPL